jgi:putative salt-induced outer membrane protein
MKKTAILAAAVLSALSATAAAADWTGTGELGLALARGNARSENLNGKLAFATEDANWKHSYHASVLRAKGEVVGDFDGDGTPEERFDLNANRYELGATSALKVNEISSWIAALRYENDDFAPFDHQSTFSLGYGHQFIASDATSLRGEIGPGYRRAKESATGDTVSDVIVRGLVDYKHKLTGNTQLFNTLLLESGDDNTFAQNDFGVAVAMNESFALKAGIQLRHNTDVGPNIDKTDTLTTVNLVYNIK